MAFRSPSPSMDRRSASSQSPERDRHRRPSPAPRSRSRSASRSHGSYSERERAGRSRSRSKSRSKSRSRSRSPPPRPRDNRRGDRGGRRAGSPPPRSAKVVVERLTKNVNEDHLYEIFGEFGHIRDLDLPISRVSGTNRGTAYILFGSEADAESAVSHMHEAQLDGNTIHVSVVLPRRVLAKTPRLARRTANFGPRTGPAVPGGAGGGRRTQGGRFGGAGPRNSDTYRPRSVSPGRRSPSPPARDEPRRHRKRSPSIGRSRSRSRSRSAAPARDRGYASRQGHDDERGGSAYGTRA